MNKRLALLLCLVVAFHMGACTSNDSRDDEAAAEESMSGDESLEDVEGLDGDAVADDSMSGDESFEEAPADSGDMTADSGMGGDEEGFSEDALSDDGGAVADAAPSDTAPADGGFSEADMGSDNAFADSGLPADNATVTETPPMSEMPPVSEPPPAVDPGGYDPGPSSSSASSGRSYPVIPVRKIESAPFERDGVLLNAVYFARPGDTFSKVAKMIYQDTKKTKELRNVNPDTMPRVGDPIYYNSPNRPTDNAVMKVYYDDAGIQPKVYLANEGDDLKRVSKELLGFDGAWKEVWASNSVESKSKIPAGTELRYYSDSPGGELAPPTMAQNTPPAQDMGMPPAPDMGMDQMPPPPDMGMADPGMPPAPDMGMPPDMADVPPPPDNMLPPPDGMPDAGMAGMNDMPTDLAPPPPPPPPPPAPPENNMAQNRPDLAADGSDNDMMLALGAAGGIAVLLAVVMVMRRKRQQREMAAAFGDTQVGT